MQRSMRLLPYRSYPVCQRCRRGTRHAHSNDLALDSSRENATCSSKLDGYVEQLWQSCSLRLPSVQTLVSRGVFYACRAWLWTVQRGRTDK